MFQAASTYNPGSPLPARSGGSGTLDLNNPLDQLTVERGLTSAWTEMLSDREMRVFQFIIRMTTGFSRLTWRFTYRQFSEGNDTCAGLHRSEPNLRAALKGLQASGHITIDPDRQWGLTITVNLKGLYKVLATPKRLKQEKNSRRDTPHEIDTPPPTKSIPLPHRNRGDQLVPVLEPELEPETVVAAATAVQPVLDFEEGGKIEPSPSLPAKPIFRVRTRPIAAPPEPAHANPLRLATTPAPGPAKAPTLSAKAAETTWHRAAKLAPAGDRIVIRAWTIADKGKFNAALGRTWTADPAKLHEFIEWSVSNWTRIITDTFRWMTKTPPPVMPNLGFFLAQRERFLDAFNRNTIAADRDALDTVQERRLHEMVTSRGFTQAEAERVILRDQAKSDLRGEMDKREQEVARQARVNAMHERDLVKRFGNKPLPHRNAAAPRPAYEPYKPAPPPEPYDGPPLIDMPEWGPDTRAPIPAFVKPVANFHYGREEPPDPLQAAA